MTTHLACVICGCLLLALNALAWTIGILSGDSYIKVYGRIWNVVLLALTTATAAALLEIV